MKILLGTAQFDKNYGISRSNKEFNFNQKKLLIKFARQNQIEGLDTAAVYKNAETELGKIGVNDFKIISKLPKLKKNAKVRTQILSALKLSLNKLKLKRIYGILIHDLKDLNGSNKDEYLDELKNLKRLNLVKKIGISLYDVNDIKKIIKYWKPDIIQIPFNIFDRRLNNKIICKIIKKNKIEVHARSIFLQGILTKRNKKKRFNKWKKLFDAWFNWCNKNNMQPYEVAYLYAKNNNIINKIVIGFENFDQLKKIIKIKKKIRKFPDLECKDEMLINPFNWNK